MALVSIVVPVYHNATSLADLLAIFQEIADQNADDSFEFVFVDDGSGDDSYAVLRQLAQVEPRMHIIKLSRNFGSNPAIMAGLAHAQGDAVVAIAADLQDPPELIHDMLAQWRNGNKVVLAARKHREDHAITAFLADTFYRLFRRYAIPAMPERGFDFFLIDRHVTNLINNINEANPYLMGLILWLGFDPHIIYYDRRARDEKYGVSMWTVAKKIKYFVDSFVAFSYFPVRVTSLMGFTLAFVGIVYAIAVIIGRLLFDIEAEGWASLMVVLLIVSGTQMVMIGILGEYLWRNLDETRKRPRFIIEEITPTNISEPTSVGKVPQGDPPSQI